MVFAAYIPVEQEVIVTVIMNAVSIFTCFWCTRTHIQSKPRSNFALRHRPRRWSTKLARIKHVDLIQFLSDWLTYSADNIKARIPLRVWKMFGFYFIKRFWNAKVTNLRMFHPPSLQKMWKWLRICGNEATIDCHHGSGVKLIIAYLSLQLSTTVG